MGDGLLTVWVFFMKDFQVKSVLSESSLMVFKTESRQRQPRKFCQKAAYDGKKLALLKRDEENRPMTVKKIIRFFSANFSFMQRWAFPIELRYSNNPVTCRLRKKYRNIGITWQSGFNYRTSNIGLPIVR
jgi:hypothetical protein